MSYCRVSHIDEPYHKGYNWQVDFDGKAKQWYKSEAEAIKAKETWDNITEMIKDDEAYYKNAPENRE